MKSTLWLLLSAVFCGLFTLHAEAPRVIRVDLPDYSAEITEKSLLSIRSEGKLLFSERFFLHDGEGKELASGALAASDMTADEARKVFSYTKEVPNRFRLTKTIRLSPAAVKLEWVAEILGDAPLKAGELNLLLNSIEFGGKSYAFGEGKTGVLPVEEAKFPEVAGIRQGRIGEYDFLFDGPRVTLIDTRGTPARWTQNSFRFRDSRIKLEPGKTYSFSVTVARKRAGAAGVQLAEMEVVKFTPVDISGQCNMGFKENDAADDGKGGWTDEGPGGNDFRNFPPGEGNFAGVPFTILDPAQNNGKSCIVLGGQPKRHLPPEVVIPIRALAASVYFLHTAAWMDSGVIGDYTIRYQDGSTIEIPLKYGQNITGWWNPVNTPESAVGWRGTAPRFSPVGINVFGWNNPHPEKEIASIHFRSGMLTCVPILAGITLSNQKVSLVRSEEKERRTDTRSWVPFVPAYKSVLDNALNISSQINRHAPAGKYGFVTVRNGRFEFENGERALFFGGSLPAAAPFPPTREEADNVAAYLAKIGCNIIRIHLYDDNHYTEHNTPRTNIFGKGADSSALDPERMDQLDYLMFALKKQGIYAFWDLHSARAFTEKDGVKVGMRDKFGNSREFRGFYFDPATMAANRKFLHELLLHRNPYTGNRYVDEPALALTVISNENTLFLFGIWRRLDGSYEEQLQKLWNEWLLKRYRNRAALATAWSDSLQADEDPAAGTVKLLLPVGMPLGSWGGAETPKMVDSTRFIYDLQTNFYVDLKDELRGIGLKVPITGSHALFLNPPDIQSQAALDFVDMHPYFFGRRPMSQADLPDFDTVTQLALSRVKGKPVTVTEWNYHNKDIFPWRNDAPLMVAAYARLQDADCLIVHAYSHSYSKHSYIMWNQNIITDPVFVGQWQTASNLFLRGDAMAAKTTRVAAAYTVDGVFSRSSGRPPVGFTPYRQKLETVFNAPADLKPEPLPPEEPVVRSDTGELTWHRQDGVLYINTPKTQAVIGRLEKIGVNPNANLKVAAQPPEVTTISVTALDDLPIGESKRLLLTACGRCENTGMVWDASGYLALNRGKAPVLIEPVKAEVRLEKLREAKAFTVYPLNPDGSRMPPVPTGGTGDTLSFTLAAPTIYYEITAQ